MGEANAEIKALRLAERLREKAVEEVTILSLHAIPGLFVGACISTFVETLHFLDFFQAKV